MMDMIVYAMFAIAALCVLLAVVEYFRITRNIERRRREEGEIRKKWDC